MMGPMTKRTLYRLLALSNDLNALNRGAKTGSLDPIARRLARRAYGKATGRLARKLFG